MGNMKCEGRMWHVLNTDSDIGDFLLHIIYCTSDPWLFWQIIDTNSTIDWTNVSSVAIIVCSNVDT